MAKKIIFFFIIPLYICSAQQDSLDIFEVEYKRELIPENLAKVFTSYYFLQKNIDDKTSIFDKISQTNTSEDLVNDVDDDGIFYYTPKKKNTTLIYKDYSSNDLFSNQDIAYKYFVIKDSLSIFNWQIKEDTKEILGYSCQLATTNFRGRKYEAWFASELPIGGPWKFDGLPGMILTLKTEKPFIFYEAISIKSDKIKSIINENPFKNEKSLNWQEFKDLYKEKAINLSKYSTESGNQGGIILPRRGIEQYIDENDTDYKADKEFEKKREAQTQD